MASPRALAIRREAAVAGLVAAATDLAATLDLPPLALPANKDAEVAAIMQLEAITEFLRTVQGKQTPRDDGPRTGAAEPTESATKPTRKGKAA